jgi:transcription antitermination factor NusG
MADITPHADLPNPPSNWHALRTYSRHEKTVTRQLRAEGFEMFLPIYQEEHRWSDRRKHVELPLFPGYVFVRLADYVAYRVAVLRTPGVLGFVGNVQQASLVMESEIEDMRLLLSSGIACRPHPYLMVGQRVRIKDGALAGIQGILTSVENDRSLVLSVNLIQRSLSMRVQGYTLEVV